MADSNFTYQIEYSLKKGSYVPLLSCSSGGIPYHSQFTPILNPLKFRKKKPEIIELSRQERAQLALRRVIDRFKQRFTEANFTGHDQAVAFLEDKKRQGFTANTIRTSSSVIFSFLSLVHSIGRNLGEISKEDIAAYVEHEQDRGNTIVAIKTKLTALYPFLSYLVGKELADPTILKNKYKVKLPDPLPRSIDAEDMERLLPVLEYPVDKAIVLITFTDGDVDWRGAGVASY